MNIPIGASAAGWWRVETGFGRMYDLSELDQLFVSGGYRYKDATVSLGYAQFGQADLYTEKSTKGSVAYSHRALSAGFSLSFLALGFGGGYSGLSAASFGIGFGVKQRRWQLALAADELNSPTFTINDPKREPRISVHGEFLSGNSQSFQGRASLQRNESPQYGAGQRIAIGKSSALSWGFTTSPFTLSGGIELGRKSGHIVYSANYHPVLGITHVVSISCGTVRLRSEKNDGLR